MPVLCHAWALWAVPRTKAFWLLYLMMVLVGRHIWSQKLMYEHTVLANGLLLSSGPLRDSQSVDSMQSWSMAVASGVRLLTVVLEWLSSPHLLRVMAGPFVLCRHLSVQRVHKGWRSMYVLWWSRSVSVYYYCMWHMFVVWQFMWQITQVELSHDKNYTVWLTVFHGGNLLCPKVMYFFSRGLQSNVNPRKDDRSEESHFYSVKVEWPQSFCCRERTLNTQKTGSDVSIVILLCLVFLSIHILSLMQSSVLSPVWGQTGPEAWATWEQPGQWGWGGRWRWWLRLGWWVLS